MPSVELTSGKKVELSSEALSKIWEIMTTKPVEAKGGQSSKQGAMLLGRLSMQIPACVNIAGEILKLTYA